VPDSQQRHEMILEGTQPSGADEWSCPTCGRRIVMRPPPDYQKIVLDPGDELAIHVGGKGGVRVGAVDVTPAESGEDERAWRDWLDSIGIDWDGPAA
jgi:DNA-directed RNA polymerase subunit RPC12/RpoP